MHWYLVYSLSYRNIEEIMLQRGTQVDHWWVIHYAPLLEEEFRKDYERKIGSSWHIDATYLKIKDVLHCLYHAVDKEEDTIDFILTKKRDESIVKVFFEKHNAIGWTVKVTRDRSDANKARVD